MTQLCHILLYPSSPGNQLIAGGAVDPQVRGTVSGEAVITASAAALSPVRRPRACYFYPLPACDSSSSSSTEPVFVLSRAAPGVPACPPSCQQTPVKQCCHSSHLWINEVLSSQVCSGTGNGGAKACSVPQLQVSEVLAKLQAGVVCVRVSVCVCVV